MSLNDSEIAKIKAELGYNLLNTGALPYIGITQVFEQVIQSNVLTGASTTSSTTVTAATSPTPSTLTLTSATGFSAGDRVVIDVDDREEVATTQNLSGTSLTVLLTKAHTGTYPVSVESGETLIRQDLRRIASIKDTMAETFGEGAVRKVDELEFYQNSSGSTFGALGDQLTWWREQLAAHLGVPSMWARQRQGAQTLSVY